MASKITGIAVVFGFPGGVAWAGAIKNLSNEGGDFEHNVQVDEVRDADNELMSLAHSGETYDATLQFTPRAASGTNTLASAAASLAPPEKGAAVTLGQAAGAGAVDFKLAVANSSQWVYVGGWKTAFKKNGVATYELKIKRNPNADISTAVN
jgi:hypothetical protein